MRREISCTRCAFSMTSAPASKPNRRWRAAAKSRRRCSASPKSCNTPRHFRTFTTPAWTPSSPRSPASAPPFCCLTTATRCVLSDGEACRTGTERPSKAIRHGTGTKQTPRPIYFEDVGLSELSDALKETVAREHIAAVAFIPILIGGRLAGKFMAYYDRPHHFVETGDRRRADACAATRLRHREIEGGRGASRRRRARAAARVHRGILR